VFCAVDFRESEQTCSNPASRILENLEVVDIEKAWLAFAKHDRSNQETIATQDFDASYWIRPDGRFEGHGVRHASIVDNRCGDRRH
jgi:hypothetical protein